MTTTTAKRLTNNQFLKKVNDFFTEDIDKTKLVKILYSAKEARALLLAGKLKPTTGVYFGNLDTVPHSEAPLETHLATVPVCEVCALGALLIGYVMRYNGIKCKEFYYASEQYSTMQRTLKGVFSEKQMCLIEFAFEMSNEKSQIESKDTVYEEFKADDHKRLKYLLKDYDNNLPAILNNIIANRGVFRIPEKATRGMK